MSRKGNCRRWQRCESFKIIKNCNGCSFPYLVDILGGMKKHLYKYLIEKHFFNCSSKRRGPSGGGRIALDEPLRELLLQEIQGLEKLTPKDLHVSLKLRNDEKIDFRIKCDGAFQFTRPRARHLNTTYFFLEVKGYRNDTNNVLSTIAAAQITKRIPKYKNCRYYYVGVGDSRNDLIKSDPYVRWAESEGIVKFFGLSDVNMIIKEIKEAG